MQEHPPDPPPQPRSIVDLASEDSFPASDPPPWTSGVVRPAPDEPDRRPRPDARRNKAEPGPAAARLR